MLPSKDLDVDGLLIMASLLYFLFIREITFIAFFGRGAVTLTNDEKKEKRFIYWPDWTELLVKNN